MLLDVLGDTKIDGDVTVANTQAVPRRRTVPKTAARPAICEVSL